MQEQMMQPGVIEDRKKQWEAAVTLVSKKDGTSSFVWTISI